MSVRYSDPVGVRTCAGCGLRLTPDAFDPCKRCADGLRPRCRDCEARRTAAREHVQFGQANEAREHRALFDWVYQWEPRFPSLQAVVHPPNEGKRGPMIVRHMGIRSGLLDVLVLAPSPCGGAPGLAIELKANDNEVTPDQADWIERLRAVGWQAGVHRSYVPGEWVEAAKTIARHLCLPGDVTKWL